MAYANYGEITLRASAASSGTSGQDASVSLPLTTRELWVTVTKTAEANADNVLSVRLQGYITALAEWVDLPYYWLQVTGSITTAADTATATTRVPNIVDVSSSAAFTQTAYYTELPSNTVRTIWIASGTTPSHTFSCIGAFAYNRF